MRQVGILAAAGIVALEEMADRLADDHANAKKLAEGLANMKGIAIDPDRVACRALSHRLEGSMCSSWRVLLYPTICAT